MHTRRPLAPPGRSLPLCKTCAHFQGTPRRDPATGQMGSQAGAEMDGQDSSTAAHWVTTGPFDRVSQQSISTCLNPTDKYRWTRRHLAALRSKADLKNEEQKSG
eukprot:3084259-Prymnesium_polylepis.1